jgi:hypothetical protein
LGGASGSWPLSDLGSGRARGTGLGPHRPLSHAPPAGGGGAWPDGAQLRRCTRHAHVRRGRWAHATGPQQWTVARDVLRREEGRGGGGNKALHAPTWRPKNTRPGQRGIAFWTLDFGAPRGRGRVQVNRAPYKCTSRKAYAATFGDSFDVHTSNIFEDSCMYNPSNWTARKGRGGCPSGCRCRSALSACKAWGVCCGVVRGCARGYARVRLWARARACACAGACHGFGKSQALDGVQALGTMGRRIDRPSRGVGTYTNFECWGGNHDGVDQRRKAYRGRGSSRKAGEGEGP